MLKKILLPLLIIASASALSAVKVGDKAPGFTLVDSNGQSHNLSDFAGKTVVLEWFNPKCPFVVKHYDSANMQSLQKKWTEQGVVWLTINSTNKSHQDYISPEQTNAYAAEKKAAATAFLMDTAGDVGRAYEARTTPHMYIITGEGIVVYNGAIDSIRSANAADIPKADNYLDLALSQLSQGQEIASATTRPYGCSIKF